MRTKIQSVEKIARIILAPIGVLFVAYIGVRYWEDLRLAFGDFNHTLFAASVATAILGNLGAALLFRSLLVKHNTPISVKDAAAIFYVSQVTKYVPGKIWSILYQVSHVEGRTGTIAVVLSNIELMAVGVITTLTIAISLLNIRSYPSASIAGIAFGICFTYYISRANPLYAIRNYLGKKFDTEHRDAITRSSSFVPDFAAYWGGALFFLIANITLLSAFFDLDMASNLSLIGYLMLAWAVSVFAVVLPAGIGVREVVFLLLAGGLGEYPDGLLAAVAIVSRFWQVTTDFLGAVIVVFLRRNFREM